MRKLKEKILNNKKWFTRRKTGMTYVELIVVLSIFAALSTVAMFDYGKFQDNVDLKNLTSDIALKIIEAQKASIGGNISTHVSPLSNWRPAYGVYFDTNNINSTGANSKNFLYFADLNNDTFFNDVFCTPSFSTVECLDKISITRNDYISNVEILGTGCPSITNLSIAFKRPDSSAIITSGGAPMPSCIISSAKITVASPRGNRAFITIYPSGRIQIN